MGRELHKGTKRSGSEVRDHSAALLPPLPLHCVMYEDKLYPTVFHLFEVPSLLHTSEFTNGKTSAQECLYTVNPCVTRLMHMEKGEKVGGRAPPHYR